MYLFHFISCSLLRDLRLRVASKGFWSEVLGVGDFYFALAVQAIEACISLRALTGGLVELHILKKYIARIRNNPSGTLFSHYLASVEVISDEDVEKAIETLKPLESGYCLVRVQGKMFVQSVPRELSSDQTEILACASSVWSTGTLIFRQAARLKNLYLGPKKDTFKRLYCISFIL